MPIPLPPRTQALQPDSDWKVPPLDGSLNLPQMLHFNYSNNGHKPLFVYVDKDDSLQHVTWRSAVSATHSVAAILSKIKAPPRSVIAIFSSMDTITYWAYMHGIMAAGYQPFPIQARNHDSAVARLLRISESKAIIIDGEGTLHTTAVSAIEKFNETSSSTPINAFIAQSFEKIISQASTAPIVGESQMAADLDSSAMVLHSAGSSSEELKIIHFTHKNLISITHIPWYDDLDICDVVVGIAPLPMFHVMATAVATYCVSTGAILSVFPPLSSPMSHTPEEILECYTKTSTTIGVCHPIHLEDWAKNQAHVEASKRLAAIIYAGGPLAKHVGDYLTQQGVPVVCAYGATEVGGSASTVFHRPLQNGNWEYFSISNLMKPVFVPQDDGTGTVELYLLPHERHTPSVLNSKVDGQDCFATNDLLEPHPEIDGLWKHYGRLNSFIIHSTGAKTNPEPIEAAICDNPLVRSAVMFGQGQTRNGVILELLPEHAFDPTDAEKLEELRSAVWPFIEKANESSLPYSRLTTRELILVASPSKPFLYTAKNTPRRATVIKDYAEEIDAAYQAADASV